jgi:hypothetical protein
VEKLNIILMGVLARLKKSNLLHGKTLYLGTSYPGNSVFHLSILSFCPLKTHSKKFLQRVQRQFAEQAVLLCNSQVIFFPRNGQHNTLNKACIPANYFHSVSRKTNEKSPKQRKKERNKRFSAYYVMTLKKTAHSIKPLYKTKIRESTSLN